MTRYVYVLIFAFVSVQHVTAEVKRWNGSASKEWSDVLNWTPSGLPLDSDNVLLDNTLLAVDYIVTLPAISVSIMSLEIIPAAGRKIDVRIPSANLMVPALTLHSTGNALIINTGAVFKNSSGLTSGQSLTIAGKLVIRNGGVYIHNTRASHATGIIAKLSTDPGTEKGAFEFDVPGGAYSISLSNRNYGSLKLSAIASDGTQTYNATGSSITNIRGDLEIGKGVVFNLDLEKSLTISGDFMQYGGVFNLASQPNNFQVIFKGSFIQDSAAVITETSTGLPEISFEATSNQLVSMRGAVINSVAISINNPYGIFLNADLPVPYLLHLRSGNIRSFRTAMLKISDNAVVSNASSLSFVDGPVMKTGDKDFEFPIGRQGDYAPLKIFANNRKPTDQCVAEYHHGDPQLAYGTGIETSPILRISSLEYWTVEQGVSAAQEKLSLSVGPYSHATSLEKLIISQWDVDRHIWMNIGNTEYSGISSGSITSAPAIIRGAFTVGTTVADQNPLPVYFEGLKGEWIANDVRLTWKAYNQTGSDKYRVDFSVDGLTFNLAQTFSADSMTSNWVFTKSFPGRSGIFARVVLLQGGDDEIQSQTVLVRKAKRRMNLRLYPSLAQGVINVNISEETDKPVIIQILDQNGKIMQTVTTQLKQGLNEIPIAVRELKKGNYYARVTDIAGTNEIIKFLKL